MAEPRERPVLFSGPMVRAILDGRKTQTRRAITLQPNAQGLWPRGSAPGSQPWDCPYGQPGDRLWVRETWRTAQSFDMDSPRRIAERCLDANYSRPWAPIIYEADGVRRDWYNDFGDPGKTRVSLHMPRWASRLTLEVTGVRVERLQDITEDDARTEGVDTLPDDATARERFHSLWDSINGPNSWNANPWVWVVAFRRAEVRHG